MKLTDFKTWLFGPTTDKRTEELPPTEIKKSAVKIPTARSSEPPSGNLDGFSYLKLDSQLVKPGYQFEVIELLRSLSINNENISQAISNYVALANTGHKIEFDSAVKDTDVDKMRAHLTDVVDTWHYGSAGMHGLINKFIAQALLTGAVAGETVPNLMRTGVHRIGIILPETVRFKYNRYKEAYEPFQKVKTALPTDIDGLRPLNVNTFKYFSINGDTELPYGNPLYLPALGPLNTQRKMLENIDFIISQMGIMGFLELLVDKPEQQDGESDDQYRGRLTTFLASCKVSVQNSMRDGVMVGYQDDHEFKFHSASASAQGVAELYQQNENRIFSGVKQDPTLSGRSGAGEATTIIFTKLLSELANIQLTVAKIIEHAYTMELRLAGFQFRKLTVKFNASTIQDDLKLMQAKEIKIRNYRQMRMDGLISQDQYADALDIDKPFKQEPVVPFAPVKEGTGDPAVDAQKKAAREKSKDASDRKVRAKNKPQGKTK